jgi:hypothetical protein
MGIACYVSVCVQLYFVGFHCFTTCLGLHGHLQVCRIFYFHCLKDYASLLFFCLFFTWSNSACFHPYENKIFYTREDGHVGRNM